MIDARLLKRALPVFCCLALTLTACSQKQVPIEDNPNEKAAAYAVAKAYISEFSQLKLEKVLDLSTFPFLAEGEVYQNRADLREELSEEFEEEEPLQIEIQSMRFYSLEDLRLWKREMYDALKEKGFTNHYLIVAELRIDGDTDRGFLLLQRDAQGQWKIAGVDN